MTTLVITFSTVLVLGVGNLQPVSTAVTPSQSNVQAMGKGFNVFALYHDL